MAGEVRVRLGLAAAIVAAFAAGCGPFGGEDGEDASAERAAAAYRAELEEFAADLKGANNQELARLAADPPALEPVESDEVSYVAAGELAGRVEPIADELHLLATLDARKEGALANRLYDIALRFADSVISRSGDYQFSGGIFEGEASTQRRATEAIEREIEAWRPYRRRVAQTPARGELFRSMLGFELEEIDDTLAIFESYQRHLRQNEPDKAALGYWDNIWPLEDPLRLLPAGVFSSKGDPYLDSLFEAKRVIRSQVRAISALAQSGEVGPGSPSVGDAYREAILAGFVSPLEKVKFKLYRINFRAWMLYRARELEQTPRRQYDEALQTIWIELIEDDRNPYDKLFAALTGFDSLGLASATDLARLRVYVKLMEQELGALEASILEPTRNAVLRALDAIKLEDFQFAAIRDAHIGEFSELAEAQERAYKSWEEAGDRIERAMKAGAKRVDSPKQLRRALERALAATQP